MASVESTGDDGAALLDEASAATDRPQPGVRRRRERRLNRRSSDRVDRSRVLAGGGDMGELMRSIDWAKTPIGPVESWSPALRSTVGLLLHNHSPLLLWWGPEFVQLYNDAYRPILGEKHPRAMGQATSECWSEIWHIIGPMVERPYFGGPASTSDDLLLGLRRKGFFEETHFRVAYSPVPDDTVEETGIGGVLATVTENTEQVYVERQLRTLRDLGERSAAAAQTMEDACIAAAATLGSNPWDVPFALFYSLDEKGKHARRVASVAFAKEFLDKAAPLEIDLAEDSAPARAIRQAITPQSVVVLEDLSSYGPALPRSPWAEAPLFALVLPLTAPELATPYGVMICGVSPHRALDTAYRTFFELAAGQVVIAIRNARALEDERKRANALAEIDRAKTTFFANVSHEFRTPLTLMIGPTEDLLSGTYGEIPTEQRAQLELLRRNELRLQRLVNALLEFSRIEAGRMQASFEQLDLAAHTRDLASSFRAAVERAGLKFLVYCSGVGDDVFVDRNMWEHIVLNLLSNAFKFTFEGEIAISLWREGESVILQVRDTGVGVPPENVPHLFERFHRVEGTRARTHEGSGIGLALVHELVRLHGGTVTVDSHFGVGTTFRLIIPVGSAHLPPDRLHNKTPAASGKPTGLASMFVEEALRWLPNERSGIPLFERTPRHTSRAAPHSDASRVTEPLPGTSELRVLVADDNADMRDYLHRALSPHWLIETVADGGAALAVAKEHKPDLILTDVMMPVMDGFRLLKALRDEPSTKHIPVIMLSARAGEEARVEGLQAGADDYLVKPFSTRELVARIATRLELAKLRNELLREHQHVYSLLMQISVPICVFRGEELVFEMVNDAMLKLLAHRDLLGQRYLDAYPEVKDQGFADLLINVMRTGEGFVNEEMPARFDRLGRGQIEETYWTLAYAPLRGKQGDSDRVMVAATEVTHQVLARRGLEQDRAAARARQAEAEAALCARDEFFTVASHELRTPLTTLGLQLDGLLQAVGGKNGDAQTSRWRRRAENARTEANRLESVIETMLDVFQLRRESLVLSREEADLAEVVGAVVDRFTVKAKRTLSRIELSAVSVVGCFDIKRLEQIMEHLLSNAVKFGGKKTVRVVVEGDDHTGKISVIDEGMGIAREDQARIFERLERTESAKDYGGFGLGLWIVRELVTAMRGTVTVKSELGRGATFMVEIPRHP